jgi:hypothetical protein
MSPLFVPPSFVLLLLSFTSSMLSLPMCFPFLCAFFFYVSFLFAFFLCAFFVWVCLGFLSECLPSLYLLLCFLCVSSLFLLLCLFCVSYILTFFMSPSSLPFSMFPVCNFPSSFMSHSSVLSSAPLCMSPPSLMFPFSALSLSMSPPSSLMFPFSALSLSMSSSS